MKKENETKLRILNWDGNSFFHYTWKEGADDREEHREIGFRLLQHIGHEASAEGYLWGHRDGQRHIATYWTPSQDVLRFHCISDLETLQCWKQITDLCLSQIRLHREAEAWDKESE